MADAFPKPSWRVRRAIIIGTLIFCAAEILYLTVWGQDTDLAETIANGLILLAASVIGAYVFGAVWDDRNVMAMRVGQGGDAAALAMPKNRREGESFPSVFGLKGMAIASIRK
jgi:hypothetical protein